jgi:hypothetical protein
MDHSSILRGNSPTSAVAGIGIVVLALWQIYFWLHLDRLPGRGMTIRSD